MFPHRGDSSYSPDTIRILPRLAEPDEVLVVLARSLIRGMHPLNADAVYEQVERVLGGLSGRDTDQDRDSAMMVARDRRDAMKRMGAGRIALGKHPVPDHLRHLLQPGEA